MSSRSRHTLNTALAYAIMLALVFIAAVLGDAYGVTDYLSRAIALVSGQM